MSSFIRHRRRELCLRMLKMVLVLILYVEIYIEKNSKKLPDF